MQQGRITYCIPNDGEKVQVQGTARVSSVSGGPAAVGRGKISVCYRTGPGATPKLGRWANFEVRTDQILAYDANNNQTSITSVGTETVVLFDVFTVSWGGPNVPGGYELGLCGEVLSTSTDDVRFDNVLVSALHVKSN